jgi:hypothetical protein
MLQRVVQARDRLLQIILERPWRQIFPFPGPENNRCRAFPFLSTVGGELACIEHHPIAWIRVQVDRAPTPLGVSMPLLLMPFGIVPSSDVSMLLSSVTGSPEVIRATKPLEHPRAPAR